MTVSSLYLVSLVGRYGDMAVLIDSVARLSHEDGRICFFNSYLPPFHQPIGLLLSLHRVKDRTCVPYGVHRLTHCNCVLIITILRVMIVGCHAFV